MQTMQQRRAAAALTAVTQHRGQTYSGKLCSYLHALPAMIHMNGLGQAAAFIRGKAGGSDSKAAAHRAAYDLLSDWLCAAGQPYSAHRDLLDGITGDDMHRYRLAQAEAQAYLDWVKKFAAAYLAEPEGGESR